MVFLAMWIIAGFATSLDGFIEGPNGEIDWIIFNKEEQKRLAETWKRIDTMFHGRKTYEAAVEMQRKSKNKYNPFAHMKHYVFSNSLKEVDDGYVLIGGDIKTQVEMIKAEEGKDIAIFGGAQLLSSLLIMGLVDELELAVMPVILGNGKAMFQNINSRLNLELKESKRLSSGIVSLTYELRKGV